MPKVWTVKRNPKGNINRGINSIHHDRRPIKPQRNPIHTLVDSDDYAEYYSNTEENEGQKSLFGEGEKGVNKVLYRFLPFIVHSLSGAVCYYFSRIACKLCMQSFSYSLPLTIITPGVYHIKLFNNTL